MTVVAVWGAIYIPAVLTGRFFPARDLAATHLPWRAVWADQVRSGVAPLWDPCSNQGRPLLANPNAMAAYPGTLIFALLDPEVGEVVHIALHHFLFVAGLWVLCLRTGSSPAAAAVAAATVGGCGVAWSATSFLNVLASLSWTPWALALVAAAPSGTAIARRRSVGSGVLLGTAFLAGEPVVAGLAGLAWLVCIAAGWSRAHWRWAALAVPTAFAVSAPVLLPLLCTYPDTVRGALGVPPGALAADALAPRRLLELVLPSSLGAPLGDAASGFWAAASFPWQRYYPTVFLGSLTFLLLPLAWKGRSRLAAWWAIFAGASGLALLMGFPPASDFAESLPGVAGIRFSIKLLVPAMISLAPLLAAGWDRFAVSPRWRPAAAALLVSAAALAIAVGPLQPLWRAALQRAYPASAEALARVPAAELRAAVLGDCAALALPPLVLLAAGPAPTLVAGAALVAGAIGGRGVMLHDQAARWAIPPRALRAAAGEAPVVAAMATRGSPEDGPRQRELRRFWESRATLVAGYATRFRAGYVLTRGPDGLEPLRQELLSARAERLTVVERSRLAAALGATLIVADAPADGWNGSWVDGVWVGVRDDVARPAYLAQRLLPAEGVVAAALTMSAESFRPGVDAVVDGSGALQSLAGGTVVALPSVPHHRTFRTDTEGPGFLVLQQSYLPAWQARIDERRVAVEVANGALVGVPVPPGRHSVEIFLDPLPYRLGAYCPLLLLLALSVPRAVAALRDRREASGAAVRSSPATPSAR